MKIMVSLKSQGDGVQVCVCVCRECGFSERCEKQSTVGECVLVPFSDFAAI